MYNLDPRSPPNACGDKLRGGDGIILSFRGNDKRRCGGFAKLLVAASDPKDKEIVIHLIMNMLAGVKG